MANWDGLRTTLIISINRKTEKERQIPFFFCFLFNLSQNLLLLFSLRVNKLTKVNASYSQDQTLIVNLCWNSRWNWKIDKNLESINSTSEKQKYYQRKGWRTYNFFFVEELTPRSNDYSRFIYTKRSNDRDIYYVTMQFVPGYRVLAWENDTLTRVFTRPV